MKPLLKLMNTPDNIFQDAYAYIMIISVGITANIFYNLFSAYLRAVGNSKIPLFFLVFSACLNIVLDLLFIVKFQLGVSGAAWATNLSLAVSAILSGIYIWKKAPDLKPDRDMWKLSAVDSKIQLAAGIPMAFQFAITASRHDDHAGSHQSLWFRRCRRIYCNRQTAKRGNPGNGRYGTDDGYLLWTKLRLRRSETYPFRCKISADR